jgi:tRNA threonylcarbamoyladenosine biosynthesis protein TsaB
VPAWILAIDTSATNGGIALSRDGALIEAIDITTTTGFDHILFADIDALFKKHHLRAADIACFAAASGPGSFTGLRVALAAVKGLAEAVNKPALAVSNLQAVAWHGTSDLRAPYFDARRQQVYCGLFNSQLEPLAPESVQFFDAWRAALPSGAALVTFLQSLAPAVAAIAYQRFLTGDLQDPAAIAANYVRQSDAELHWTDERHLS